MGAAPVHAGRAQVEGDAVKKLIKPEVRQWLRWPVAIVLVLGWIGAGAWFWGVIIKNLASIILVVLLALATHWAYNEFFVNADQDKGGPGQGQ
jgi:hypothetical protein